MASRGYFFDADRRTHRVTTPTATAVAINVISRADMVFFLGTRTGVKVMRGAVAALYSAWVGSLLYPMMGEGVSVSMMVVIF
jgi:hypothetical protein